MQAVRGCRALSAYGSFWMNILIPVESLLALVAHGNLDSSTFALVSFSPCSGVWVSLVEYSVLDFSRDPASYLVRQWIHVLREALDEFSLFFHVAVNSNLDSFRFHSRRMESVHSRCFWLQLLSALFAL